MSIFVKISISALLIIGQYCHVSAQNQGDSPYFEGRIIYDFKYEGISGEMTTELAKQFIGDQQIYHFKGKMYKSELNGSNQMAQYYQGNDTLFMSLYRVGQLLWNDVREADDHVLTFKITPNVETINGILCNRLSITSVNGSMDYFYNAELKANPANYRKHVYVFWSFCLQKAEALPVKIVHRSKEAITTITAKEIEWMQLNDSIFTLPPLPRLKNPSIGAK
jgi:hypothetical protein